MTPEDVERTFHRDIAPDLFAGVTTSPRPLLVLLGGQPGAGKSRATDVLLDAYPGCDIVPIVGDDFRRFHPEYAATLRTDPTVMPTVTAAAAGQWTRLAVETGLQEGFSLLIEGTWRNLSTPTGTLQIARSRRYETHAAVVAVPAPVSLVATLTRFYDAPPDAARWTPLSAHDQTVAALPAGVHALAGSPDVDRFTILDRDGRTHLDEGLDDLAARGSRAEQAYRRLTERDLTVPELATLIQDLDRLLPEHHRRTLGDPAAAASWARVGVILESLSGGGDATPVLLALRGRIENPPAPGTTWPATAAAPPSSPTSPGDPPGGEGSTSDGTEQLGTPARPGHQTHDNSVEETDPAWVQLLHDHAPNLATDPHYPTLTRVITAAQTRGWDPHTHLPGLLAGLRPGHDETPAQALAYAITNTAPPAIPPPPRAPRTPTSDPAATHDTPTPRPDLTP